jgi:predicted P-loop ATPase
MLILVDDEGYRKSTFFEALAGEQNFADTKIDLENKDAYLQIHRAWIYEWSEVEAITRRADVARVKGFLSSKADTFRAPYERTVETHRRRGIIVGSSNSHDLVQDLDSNRRSWIVEVERVIDIEWVREHRDQLWAEALHAYGAGEAWYLLPEQEAVRREVNALFEPDNPLVDRIETVVAELAAKTENKTGIFSKDLFARLGLDPNVNKAAVSVVNSVLRRMGFSRGRVRKNGVQSRGYLPSKQPLLRVVETEAKEAGNDLETAAVTRETRN